MLCNEIEQFYFNQNAGGLLQLGVPGEVVDRFRRHWAGDLVGALKMPLSVETEPNITSLVAADTMLLLAKIGREPGSLRVAPDAGSGTKFVAVFDAFCHKFWKSQADAWKELLKMLWFGLRMRSGPALSMTVFGIGHLTVLAGHHRLGLSIARAATKSLRRMLVRSSVPVRFFYDVVAVYPFTVFVANRYKPDDDFLLDFIEKNLSRDPYYRSLFYLSSLYRAAYRGEIVAAEIYSQRLLREHEIGKLERYRVLARLMTMVPLVLRGYGHLVDDAFRELLPRVDECRDVAVKSSYLRAAALMALYRGRLQEAGQLVSDAREAGKASGLDRAWGGIDKQIAAFASGSAPFNPLVNLSVRGGTMAAPAPNLGACVVRLVQITNAETNRTPAAFADQTSRVLEEHFACQTTCLSEPIDNFSTSKSTVEFMGHHIQLVPDDLEREAYIAQQLAILAPVLRSLEQLYTDQQKARESAQSEIAYRLARQVAHDVRSPLAALEVVMKDLDGLCADRRELLQMAVNRIKEIAGDLLTSKKNTNNNTPSHDFPVALLEPLLRDALREKRVAMGGKHATVTIGELDEETAEDSAFAKIDVPAFRRVMSNILNNAVEAVGKSGAVHTSLSVKGGAILIRIRDNGCGIPKERLPLLFKEGASFGKRDGNGLGLAHARQVMNAHGGDVTIDSELGVGSAVTLILPLDEPPCV